MSTKEQIKGDSQRRQDDGTERWCREHNVQPAQNYRDLGVSAFEGDNAEIGALSQFLKLLRMGKIHKGDYLLIESFDRLSRNKPLLALRLFEDIVTAGVSIVTLNDGKVYDVASINRDPMFLIGAVMEFHRANSESKWKSLRIKASWEEKRKNIRERPMTSLCPGWLKLSECGKKFVPIPERVAVVRRIFRLAATGRGPLQIARMLRKDGVPCFGSRGVWLECYVQKIMCSRAVLGEVEPTTIVNGKRVKLDAVPGYYPVVISQELFATVEQYRRARPSGKGKTSHNNAFAKLAFDRKTGSAMVFFRNRRGDKHWDYLIPLDARRGLGGCGVWPYDNFKALFLTVCRKAALQEQEPVENDASELALQRMKLAEVEKKMAFLLEALEGGESLGIRKRYNEREEEQRKLREHIARLENDALAKPIQMSTVDWKDDKALRDNLRATVKRITMDCKAKWFKAEFFDGRSYELSVKNGFATITSTDMEVARTIYQKPTA